MPNPLNMPRGRRSRGRVTRADNARAASGPGVRILSARLPGEPSASKLVAGVQEGKRSIRRLLKRDPNLGGTSMPEADKITTTHTDVGGSGGYRGVRVLAKSNDPQSANKGKTVVRKSSPARGLRKR